MCYIKLMIIGIEVSAVFGASINPTYRPAKSAGPIFSRDAPRAWHIRVSYVACY